MILAFFDFDGTITSRDSLIEFIRFMVGDIKFIAGIIFLSPILILYKLKIIPNYKAKEYILTYFFKDINENKFKKKSQEYSLKHINKITRKKAIDKIKWHQKQKHKVVIVSASIDYWLKPWCDKHNLELISTKLETKNNILTGKLLGKNCYGVQKANEIKKQYNLNDYSYIYVYGDSSGDKEMLNLANKAFYKPFEI